MRVLFLTIALFLSLNLSAQASRSTLVHQGFATDPEGNAVSGSFNLTFRLYTEPTRGTVLWEERQTLQIENGIFNAELGSVTVFPPDLFNQDTLFLGIQFDGDSEMTPRLGLFTVPWAQHAESAVTALSVSNDVITGSNIAPQSIDASDLMPASVGVDALSPTGVTAGTYNLASITVDEDGRILSAANGSPGGNGDITGVIAGDGLSGGGTLGDVMLQSILGTSIDSTEIVDGTIVSQDLSPGLILTDNQIENALTLHSGIIDATPIGLATPDEGIFTTLTIQGSVASGLALRAYGTNLGETTELRFRELDSNGSEYVGFKAPNQISANQIWILPEQDGSAGQFLSTNGTGQLQWSDGFGSEIDGSEITDNSLTDADIQSAAAISWNKINKTGATPSELGAAAVIHTHLASDLTGGTIDDARLSTNVSLLGSLIDSVEIAPNAVSLGAQTSGNYVTNILTQGPLSVLTDGNEGATMTVGLQSNAIDFNYLANALNVDGSTTITTDATEELEVVNNGSGRSFVISDEPSDASPFVIDANGNVGIGNANPPSRFVVTPPATQVMVGGATLTADACGTIKPISSTANVTSSLTTTITTPTAAHTGCCMDVVNVGTFNIILDENTNFRSAGGAAGITLTANDFVRVCSTGTAGWFQAAAVVNN